MTTKESTNKITKDTISKKDIDSGKGMSILAYFGVLALIPYLSEKNNKFVIYHAKQGINLFILEVICSVALGILSGIFTWRLWWLVSMMYSLVGLAILACVIFGIVTVCNGETKEIPVIGGIKFIK